MTAGGDHFARPVGGFTTAERPYRCAACGEPVERRGKRTWRHSEPDDDRYLDGIQAAEAAAEDRLAAYVAGASATEQDGDPDTEGFGR